MTDLSLEVTPIPGMVVLRLDVREDSRGWFKENWQREKMTALGLPDFGPVQHNVSFNTARGATRGIHTEPWDKFVSILTGRVFGAWVDMREGPTFGTVFTIEMDPPVAVFVPRGVGNSYQTLEDATTYSYLVNEHWRPGTAYPALALDDATAAIDWPIPLAESEISEKDQNHPALDAVVPMTPLKTLIVGALGQLGRALQADFPDADLVDLVDGARDGRPRRLRSRRRSRRSRGTSTRSSSTPPPTPRSTRPRRGGPGRRLGGQRVGTRRARPGRHRAPPHAGALLHRLRLRRHRRGAHRGRAATRRSGSTPRPRRPATSPSAPRRATTSLRTSWVIGDGHNFVRTMQRLAAEGVSPSVVDDQVGRLTFTPDLSRATRHLVDSGAAYGTYNVSGSGPATSWADLAKEVFRAVRPRRRRRHAGDDRAVRRRARGHPAAAGERRPGPVEDRGHRFHHRRTTSTS